MSAARVDLYVDQGEDYYAQVYWLDYADLPMEVVGPAYMDIKANGQFMYRLSSGDAPPAEGVVVGLSVASASGCVGIEIPWEDSSDFAPGSYVYDLFVYYNVYDNSGNIIDTRRRRLIAGNVFVTAQVTGDVI